MTAPPPSAAVRTALGVSLAVVLFLATLGSVGAGFGVMTDCTNAYDCTVTGCAPCRAANSWLTAGWLAQGGLLLAGVVLAVLAARRRRLRAVRLGALLLGPSSVALFVVTTALAVAAV